MKKSFFICILALIPFINGASHNMYTGSEVYAPDTLKIVSTESLSDLAASLQHEYGLFNSEEIISVNITGKDIEEISIQEGDLFLTSDPGHGVSNNGSWFVTIGREILVPVVSSQNPYMEELQTKGIELSMFADLLGSGNKFKWGDILGTNSNEAVSIYIDNGGMAIEKLESLTGLDSEDLVLVNAGAGGDIVKSIGDNMYSLGFVRLTDISGSNLRSFVSGLSIVPVDQNGNGRIDHYENYQQSYPELTRAVWIGKYPKVLYNELRLVSNKAPVDKASLDFIDWILTTGQTQLTAGGFSELVFGELRSSLNHVYASDAEILVEDQTYTTLNRAFIWILGIIAMILLSGIVIMLSSKKSVPELKQDTVVGILDKKKVIVPGGILFDKSHTWSYMEKNGMVRVGAADFLQHITGKVSKIIPRNAGESIKRGEPMFTMVQEGKHLVLYSPVSGTIKNVNNDLTQNSSMINNSPYNDGWIYEVEPSKWMAEYRNFLMGDKYREWLSNEVARLKEFLSFQFSRKHIPELIPLMQDGGEIVDNLLENMGPDVWEEFQLGFIDNAF